MTPLDDRPDPDSLLERLEREDAQSKRGRFKIFFGFAPGVGKTYRMLQVARDLVTDQKLDVVVGVVETHRRSETAALVLGLELLPRRPTEHRGRNLDEFDLDAALARSPRILLVDELAHTNAPGSRHAKRWQDVEELLDAGIDVLSTLNVQHVESLNDVIAQITGVRVRETVPDSVLDRADAIEFVDVAPEDLLERLRQGKVYLGEQADRARQHFFQRGNLLALRELALRRAAQHVDEDVLEYRAGHGVTSTWPAAEKILVCVGPSPSSARLVRAAARMAAGLRCSWIASSVDVPTRTTSDADRARLEVHLRVAESLGAQVTRLSGPSVAAALLAFARKQNVTRVIIGKPTHSRLRDRFRGSLLDDLVRGSGDIDVHVIHGDSPNEMPATPQPRRAPRAPLRHYVGAALLVGACLAIAMLLRRTLDLPDLEMSFLLTVMLVAMWWGRGPALWAAALGVACYDFFFVPPFHTLSVHDRRYVLTFAMMFGVGFAISELTGRLRRQERDALAREGRTTVLYALTRELAATDDRAHIAEITARHAADVFVAEALVLGAAEAGGLTQLAAFPAQAALDDKDLVAARWSFEHDAAAGAGTDTLPATRVFCTPLRLGASRLGVLALVPRESGAWRSEERAFLDVFCRQVSTALERARLSNDARVAALRAKTEEMRSSLLSAVSHDLRTPLASITGAASALRDDENLPETTQKELVEAIVDQAERLERLVANLLDMTRLEAGGITLTKDWVPLDEMIGSALTRLEDRFEVRRVTVDIADDVPLLWVDPVVFEQIFVNLLENVDKYTPRGSPVEIRAWLSGDAVSIEFEDHGPGLPAGHEERVFEKFFRGAHVGVGGAGLGLAICRGIAEAHGGTLDARSSEHGAVFRLVVPRGATPPVLPSEDA